MTIDQQRRLWIIIIGVSFLSLIIVGRLVAFQLFLEESDFPPGVRDGDGVRVVVQPERGRIYDRNGAVLAGNQQDFQVGVSPSLVTRAEEMASALSPILGQPRHELLAKIRSPRAYELLASRVSPEAAEAIRAFDFGGLQLDPLPRRIYPQGKLMCHTLGYVTLDGQGLAGLEGYYEAVLAGQAASKEMRYSPITPQHEVIARQGSDLYLTIDRTVQHVAEQHLARALQEHRAVSGSIIVMDPQTGALLAMASLPCYSPAHWYTEPERLLGNPIISHQFEPGSIMKLITMAAALDSGIVTPHSTYYDAGIIELGGHRIRNWDYSAPGATDMTTLMARSLNVGAATLAHMMGNETFYHYLDRFYFGRRLGVDIMAEAGGQISWPGSELWTEADLGTASFGQGLAVTPLQMAVSAAALAHNGDLMRPYVVQAIHHEDGSVVERQPDVLSRPITLETAHQVSNMAVVSVRQEVFNAQVEGYTIAGKTGTAQIAEGGYYHPTDTIGAFIGWLPADDPELLIVVKLDRPKSSPWGSQTAAPVFAQLVEELVVLLEIPPDNVRLQADIAAFRGQ